MMSEGGDHESWDDEMMMNENNETPLPVVRIPYIHSPNFNHWQINLINICTIVVDKSFLFFFFFPILFLQLSYMSKDDNASDQEKKGTWHTKVDRYQSSRD